jgi:arsenite/tail-anchored protein-transporting ATPase
VTDPYFNAWRESQAKYSELVEDSFTPLPIFKVPLLESEVVGMDMLRRVAEVTYNGQDPSTIFFKGKPQQVIKDGDDYLLLLPLPLLDKRDVNLHRGIHDELVVRIGNWKRHISLPQALIGRQIAGARYRENQLEIRFSG